MPISRIQTFADQPLQSESDGDGWTSRILQEQGAQSDWWTLIEAASRCVDSYLCQLPTTLLSPLQGVQKTWLHNVTAPLEVSLILEQS